MNQFGTMGAAPHEMVNEEVQSFDYGFGPDDVPSSENKDNPSPAVATNATGSAGADDQEKDSKKVVSPILKALQDQNKKALYSNMLLPSREDT